MVDRKAGVALDRNKAVEELKERAAKARADMQSIAEDARRRGVRTGNAGQPGGINDKIAFRSEQTANRLASGSGDLSNQEVFEVLSALKGGATGSARAEIKAKAFRGTERGVNAAQGLREVQAVKASGLSSQEFRSLSRTERDQIVDAFQQGGSQEARETTIEQEKQRFEQGRTLAEGVQATRSGAQLVVKRGERFRNAGEFFDFADDPDKVFNPGRLRARNVEVREVNDNSNRTDGSSTSGLDSLGGSSVDNSGFNPLDQESFLQGAKRRSGEIVDSFIEGGSQVFDFVSNFNPGFIPATVGNTLGLNSGIDENRVASDNRRASDSLGTEGKILLATTAAIPLGFTGAGAALLKGGGALAGGFFGAQFLDSTIKGQRGSAGQAAVDLALSGIPFGRTAVRRTEAGLNFLDPRFVSSTDGVIPVRTTKGPVDIELAGSVNSIAEPLSTQLTISGRNVNAVSGARDLFGTLERTKTVNKPLPTPDSPPLERSFFADPRSRLRPSRLGIEPETARLDDIFSGNFQLSGNRPQAILFPSTKVERLPKNLRDVEASIKSGSPLTASQEQRLVNFQLTQSGLFKPIGFISKEPEITLAPGEVIIRRGTPATTNIRGRKVSVIEAEVTPVSKTDPLDTIIGGDIPAARRAGRTNISSRTTRPVLDFERLSPLGLSSRPTSKAGSDPLSIISGVPPNSRPVSRGKRDSDSIIPPSRNFGSSSILSPPSRANGGSGSSRITSPTRPTSRPVGSGGSNIFVPTTPKKTVRRVPTVNLLSELSGSHIAQVRRKNQWRTVATGSKKDVTRRAKTVVDNTLAASFRVLNSQGELVKPRKGNSYRSSKRDKNVAVERRKGRLDSPGEIFEIQRARKGGLF